MFEGLALLTYSQFGLKKTRTGILSFPKPLVDIDIDGGLLSLRQELKLVSEPSKAFPFTTYDCQVDQSIGFPGQVYVASYPYGKASYFDLLNDLKFWDLKIKELGVKTVLVDSGSELARLIQLYASQLPLSDKQAGKLSDDEQTELELGMSRVPQLQDWGGITERCRQVFRLVRSFKQKKVFAVITALEQIDYEKGIDGSDVPTDGLPNLPGKIRSEIGALVDEVWRYKSSKIFELDAEGKQQQVNKISVCTVPEGIWYAKSRLNLPRKFAIEHVYNVVKSLLKEE